MNLKQITELFDLANRQKSPYGYDFSESIPVGVVIDGVIYDIDSISHMNGGIVIIPKDVSKKEKVPKLLEPKKKQKEEETKNDSTE